MTDIYVGRQPIFNAKLEVVGYELLYRSAKMDKAEFLDGDRATSIVLSNTFLEIGFDQLIGDKLAFINMTRPFLLGQHPLPLSHKKLVLEILENITIDQELLDAVKGLTESGYKFALDDVTNPDDIEDIIHLASYIKVDLREVNRHYLPEHMPAYRRSNAILLAEKVETQDELDFCIELGFEYFQGYFLCKPNVIKEKKLAGMKLIIIQLLSEMQNPESEFAKIEAIIRKDVSLSYKLLRLINSAYYARVAEIKSIRQALTLLGLKQIRSWVSLLLLSEMDNKPKELMITAMVRAKMCELIAITLKDPTPETQFTVGLFSVLDALMDMPLEDILSQIPLSNEIKKAIINQEGSLGELLKCVVAYEAGMWDNVRYKNLGPESIRTCYLEAVEWARKVGATLDENP